MNDIAKELGSKHIGVKKLAAIFLERRISKNQQISNWENDQLTEPQIKYAATDAWICLTIYNEMKDKKLIQHFLLTPMIATTKASNKPIEFQKEAFIKENASNPSYNDKEYITIPIIHFSAYLAEKLFKV